MIVSCHKEPLDRYKHLYFFGDSHINRWNTDFYFPLKQTSNLGISGFTVEETFSKVLEKRIEDIEDNSIVIITGINNLLSNPFSAEVDAILESYDKIIDYCDQKDITLYICSIFSIAESVSSTNVNQLVRKTNVSLEQKCLIRDNCIFIGVDDILQNSDQNLSNSYTLDGIHLNNYGYEILSSELRERLNN